MGLSVKEDSVDCREFVPGDKSIILVVGNEGFGLRPMVEESCSKTLNIKAMTNNLQNVDSLNVSTALGIALFQISKNQYH
jgi:tRNA G18 (ribose-2'-O)-methylase SpoU